MNINEFYVDADVLDHDRQPNLLYILDKLDKLYTTDTQPDLVLYGYHCYENIGKPDIEYENNVDKDDYKTMPFTVQIFKHTTKEQRRKIYDYLLINWSDNMKIELTSKDLIVIKLQLRP
jgi:hypothetical protein